MLSRPLQFRPAWLAAFLVLWVTLSIALLSQATLAGAARGIPPAAYDLSPLAPAPTSNVIVALAPITRTTPVELVALTLDAAVSESAGHTIVAGYSTFKLHNTDVLNPISLTVGFPEWAGGSLSFSPDQFSDFHVTNGSKKVLLSTQAAPVKIGKETRNVNWYTFDLQIDPDQKTLIRVDFTQDLGDGIFPRFTYGLLPSTGWKGSIGSVRLTVTLPDLTTAEQFIALDPSLPDFNGRAITWLWTDLDPTADPGVTLIRPGVWTELLNRRAAVTQNQNDANLRVSLARVYQQLASEDTPRRDNFTSQAVAELETAARLNPKNLEALQTLAGLYEIRAGPAGSPRDVNYVALALAQWQALVGTSADAQARKNAAEDSFYLGVNARSRGDVELALKYYQDAAKFAPQGAGPFYTAEHWRTEVQAAHLALAQAALDQGDVGAALEHGRALYGPTFDLSPGPDLPAFAVDRASVTTSPSERRITLSLVPYPAATDESNKLMDQVVAALNATSAGQAQVDASRADYTLTLVIPFGEDRDLENRLEKLAQALPAREDWDIVKGVIQSNAIEWGQQVETFDRITHYREEVDLAAGAAPLQQSMSNVSKAIGDLESSPQPDDRSKLRLALLRDVQQFWQRELTMTAVHYQLVPTDTPEQNWTVNLGSRMTLAFDIKTTRTELYLVGAGAALAALFLLILLLLLVRWVRKRRSAPA